MSSIISKIVSGVVTAWHDAEKEIDALALEVKNALPASAQPNLAAAISDVKQAASDALSIADSSLAGVAPVLVRGIETLADNALVSLTNGLALPLVPMTNKGIEDASALIIAAARAWELKAKASLAANNTPVANTAAPPNPA